MEYIPLIVAVPAFTYASIGDLTERRVTNKVWLLLLPVALALFTLNFHIAHLIIFAFVFVVLLAFAKISQTLRIPAFVFRGADFKGILSLALLFPIHIIGIVLYACVASLSLFFFKVEKIPFIPCLLIGLGMVMLFEVLL